VVSDVFDTLTIKHRKVRGGFPVRVDTWHNSTGNTSTDYSFSGDSFIRVDNRYSEGHPWPPRSRVHGDVGGPFKVEHRYFSDSVRGGPKDPADFLPRYRAQWPQGGHPAFGDQLFFSGAYSPISIGTVAAPIITSTNDAVWPQTTASSETALGVYGAQAIARSKPTNPTAKLAVALAEVYREGIPHAPGVATWENRTRVARAAGSEYLNGVFGWLPLVSDIQNTMSAVRRHDQLWSQVQRDAGRVIRRSFEFPITVTASAPAVTNPATGSYSNPLLMSPTSGIRYKTRHTWSRRWFDGAFSYYLPRLGGGGIVDNFIQGFYKARRIYGLTLDPNVLWALAPWSWLVDWFVDAGDVISNITDTIVDGLVLRYGYMMEHSIMCDEYHIVGPAFKDGTPVNSKLYCVTETKQRIKATPYGFGLSWSSFSARQLAILAALGVTR
jgi:hypothetical protein